MISAFFIDRPIFASVLSILLVIAGSLAALSLPISQYPPIVPPTVQVAVAYPGASAQVVADTVAAPIEQQVNGVDGMIYMSSTSDNTGSYNLTVTFGLGIDLNDALVAVQNRVNLAVPQLPESVQKQGLTIKKKSPSILMAINFYSPDGRYDDIYLSNYATIHVKDEIFRLEGVGDIAYLGERDYSIRAWLDPQKMAARAVTAGEVIQAINQQNTALAAGQLGQQPVPAGQDFQQPFDALGRLTTPEQFGEIIVRATPGDSGAGSATPAPQVLRLKDLARLELGAQKYDQTASLNGMPSVALAIYQLPGSNALDVGNRVKAKMKELRAKFPDGLEYKIAYDTTPFISESVADVVKTLRDAVVLVAIVVLLFLQNWRATLIPLIAVPVAVIGTFAAMAVLGYSINNISMFGLVLAIGIVVDDAIVVVENVERWLAQGYSSRDAARKAMEEVTGPVVAVALVLCAVFVPCAFISGITGQFFRQFAVTIAISTVLSAFNSLTLSPALAAILLKPHAHGHKPDPLPRVGLTLASGLLVAWLLPPVFHLTSPAAEWALRVACLIAGIAAGWFVAWVLNKALALFFHVFEWSFGVATAIYAWMVKMLVRLTLLVLVIYVGMLGVTGWLFTKVPTGFIPAQDQGYLLVSVQLPESSSVQRTQEVMSTLEQVALKTPGVADTFSTSGFSILLSVYGSNYGSMFVILDPFDKRRSPDRSGNAIMMALRKAYHDHMRDAMVMVFGAPPVPGLGTAGGFKVLVEDRGDLGAKELEVETAKLIAAGQAEPGFFGLSTLYSASAPQMYADIDRAKARALQVPIEELNQTLEAYIGSVYVNNFNAFGRYWQVNVMADLPYRNTVGGLRLLKTRNLQGGMVPLAAVVDLKDTTGPGMVLRYNLYRASPVNGLALPWILSSSQAMTRLDQLAVQHLPPSMKTEWTELNYLQQQEARDVRNKIVFPLSVVFVFLVLAALYESWSLPLAVILVVPMCLLSAVVGVAVARMDINIFTQIGFVVLVGLASKNAILIVEFAKQLREEGKPLREATVEACRLRLRPILMTSFAFIFGVFPLVIALGAGAEMRRALGTAVFAGMIGVTIFGIFLTPVFFFMIQWFGERPALNTPTAKRLSGGLHVLLTVATLGLFLLMQRLFQAKRTTVRPRRRPRAGELTGE